MILEKNLTSKRDLIISWPFSPIFKLFAIVATYFFFTINRFFAANHIIICAKCVYSMCNILQYSRVTLVIFCVLIGGIYLVDLLDVDSKYPFWDFGCGVRYLIETQPLFVEYLCRQMQKVYISSYPCSGVLFFL